MKDTSYFNFSTEQNEKEQLTMKLSMGNSSIKVGKIPIPLAYIVRSSFS